MLQRFLPIYVSVLLLLHLWYLNQLTQFFAGQNLLMFNWLLGLQLVHFSARSNGTRSDRFSLFASRHGTLIYIGTAMYAFEGVAVLLPVEDI